VPVTVTKIENSPVRGFLHKPDMPAHAGIALTHGAGSNCSAPLLVAVANAFCDAGVTVLRFDLPFRQRRAHGPPYPSIAADDRAGIRSALDALRAEGLDRIFAAGHSYGGRQASMLAAEEPQACDGLLLLSYPLHPPNKPGQPRTSHFPSLRAPALFVHGTADPFASPEELTAAVTIIPARTQIAFIDKAGHDLKHGKFDINQQIVKPFLSFAVCSGSAP
jgi:predicted alpha/beta-hydrolase family hydrolase